MKRILRNLSRRGLCALLLLGILTAQAPIVGAAEAQTFSDVAAGGWYYDFVTDLSSQGVISGYPDGTFQPQRNVTVGEALALILMAAGVPSQQATGGHWASGFADYAVENGYLSASMREDLNAEMRRLDVARLAARALKLVPPKDTKSPFSDVDDGYATVLFQKGVISGTQDGRKRLFHPDDPVTRAEISSIVWQMRSLDVHEGQIGTDYYYVDVLEDVPLNEYDLSAFRLSRKGRMDYIGSGVRTSQGVDVSAFQGEIDWKKVRLDGIDFAMIRVGGRDCTDGRLYDDVRFQENIEGALKAGLKVGVYFFSQAVTEKEARVEAYYVLDKLAPYRRSISMPVVFDWEDLGDPSYRTYKLDSGTLTRCVETFYSILKKAEYEPMIYFNRYGGYRSYDLREMTDYQFWYAQYVDGNEPPEFYYKFDMWQYTSQGKVNGIEGDVDLNLYIKKR